MSHQSNVLIYTDSVTAHEALIGRFPGVPIQITDSAAEFEAAVPNAEVIFIAQKYDRSQLDGYQRLRWLHLGGTGINPLLPLSQWPRDLLLSHTPGLNAPMIADYVQCVISMLAWDFPRLMRHQKERRWEKWGVERLEGRLIGLLGLGHIGQAIVPRARAAGMRIAAVRRTPETAAGVERVVGPERLHSVLGEADFVVLALPLTGETRHLMSRAEFDAMRSSAYLINISRGAIVDEPALVAALRDGVIAGAALDVFEEEPLPPQSELWGIPNVILTPHISSWSADYRVRAANLFGDNLERYVSGQPLRHEIDRAREY